MAQWNTPMTESKGIEISSIACRFFSIHVLEFVVPGNCKSFTLKTGLLHAQVPFKTDFTVVPKVGQILRTLLFVNREPLNLVNCKGNLLRDACGISFGNYF